MLKGGSLSLRELVGSLLHNSAYLLSQTKTTVKGAQSAGQRIVSRSNVTTSTTTTNTLQGGRVDDGSSTTVNRSEDDQLASVEAVEFQDKKPTEEDVNSSNFSTSAQQNSLSALLMEVSHLKFK